MLVDANGDGLSLDQMIKDAASDALMVGRYGLLVDYPSAPEGLTDYEVSALYLRASILPYPAESIINWRTSKYGGIKKLLWLYCKSLHSSPQKMALTTKNVCITAFLCCEMAFMSRIYMTKTVI